MKRIIMSLGLCLALASAPALMAQNPENTPEGCQKEQTCKKDKKECKKECKKKGRAGKERKGDKKGKCKGRPHGEKGNKDFSCFMPGPNGERPQGKNECSKKESRLLEGIELTPLQKEELAKIQSKHNKKAEKAARKSHEKHEKMKKEDKRKKDNLRQARVKDIEKILTPEQKARFTQNLQKIKEKREKGKAHVNREFRHENSGKDELKRKPSYKKVVEAPQPMPLTEENNENAQAE